MQTDLIRLIDKHLSELCSIIQRFDAQDYAEVCPDACASIGQHVRHALEIFSLLVTQYESGIINYELRERDIILEQDPQAAVSTIQELIGSYQKPDKQLKLASTDMMISTSYERELLYQLEHIIHHNAIIKPIIKKYGNTDVQDHFGLAPSTKKHREKLALGY